MRKTKLGRDEEVPFLLELRNADQGIKEIEDRMAVSCPDYGMHEI